jgi:hypothetical protein
MAARAGLLFGSGGLGGPRVRERMERQEKHENDRHTEKCSAHFLILSFIKEQGESPAPDEPYMPRRFSAAAKPP